MQCTLCLCARLRPVGLLVCGGLMSSHVVRFLSVACWLLSACGAPDYLGSLAGKWSPFIFTRRGLPYENMWCTDPGGFLLAFVPWFANACKSLQLIKNSDYCKCPWKYHSGVIFFSTFHTRISFWNANRLCRGLRKPLLELTLTIGRISGRIWKVHQIHCHGKGAHHCHASNPSRLLGCPWGALKVNLVHQIW